MEHDEVVSRIVEEIRSSVSDFNLDDPFDDPTLVTNAFLDIVWQDEHGNSALMLAAAENRILQVKGILSQAMSGGKLWQIIDMRNKEGLNCVDMAVKSGSETCAMLITKVAREYAKLKPRPEVEKNHDLKMKDDITFGTFPKNVEQLDENYVKELVRQSSTASGHSLMGKRLSRDKVPHNVMKSSAAAGHEYLKMVKRSRSAHSRLMSQRTFSVESESVGYESSTPQMQNPPVDHGVFSSMGERIRNIFGKKPPIHSKSMSFVATDRGPPPATRPISVASKPYQSPAQTGDEDHVQLPQHSSDSQLADGSSGSGTTRNSFWSKDKVNTVTTSNAVRLPPLGLRRRVSSDPRSRNFSSLGDDK